MKFKIILICSGLSLVSCKAQRQDMGAGSPSSDKTSTPTSEGGAIVTRPPIDPNNIDKIVVISGPELGIIPLADIAEYVGKKWEKSFGNKPSVSKVPDITRKQREDQLDEYYKNKADKETVAKNKAAAQQRQLNFELFEANSIMKKNGSGDTKVYNLADRDFTELTENPNTMLEAMPKTKDHIIQFYKTENSPETFSQLTATLNAIGSAKKQVVTNKFQASEIRKDGTIDRFTRVVDVTYIQTKDGSVFSYYLEDVGSLVVTNEGKDFKIPSGSH